MCPGFAEVIEKPFPVYAATVCKGEYRLKFRRYLKEYNISERKGTVSDHRLELHAQALDLRTYLVQVASPVEGGLRWVYHHLCHSPYLRHYPAAHKRVYTAVIIVFRGAWPYAEVCEGLAVKIFRHEDSRCSHLCGCIAVEYGLDLPVVIHLRGGARSVCGNHSGHGLAVVVDTVPYRGPRWCVYRGEYRQYQQESFHAFNMTGYPAVTFFAKVFNLTKL